MKIDSILVDVVAAAKAAPELAKLRKAAVGVETMFLKDLLSVMRKSVPKTNLGKDSGGQMFRDLHDQTLAETVGKAGAMGFSAMLEKSFGQAVIKNARAQALAEINSKQESK